MAGGDSIGFTTADTVVKIRPMKTVLSLSVAASFLLATACGQHESVSDAAPTVGSSAAASATAAKPQSVPAVQQPPAGPKLTDFSCAISISGVPAEIKLGGEYPVIKVKVTNKSKTAWPALLPGRSAINAVNLAYHWVQGDAPPQESSRALLTADVKPGQTVSAELPIREVPAKAGDYVLRVEPLQEAVGWFSGLDGCKAETKVRFVE